MSSSMQDYWARFVINKLTALDDIPEQSSGHTVFIFGQFESGYLAQTNVQRILPWNWDFYWEMGDMIKEQQ